MKNQENDSTMKIIIGVVVIAVVAIGIYLSVGNKSSATKNEMQTTSAGTSSAFTADQTKAIEEIVVKVAREKTDVFMKAINDGMQLQQEKASRDLEKNATSELDGIKKNAILWGDPKAALQVYAMIDPMCPHCHDFMKTAIAALDKSKDVAFTLVVAPILGGNSVAVSKVMLASAKQSADKTKVLMGKFADKVNDLTREKLLEIIKESGIDVAKFKIDEESSEIQKQLEENVALFEKLKIPGVPTVLLKNKDGSLFAAPPVKPEVYVKLAVRIKAGEDISKPSANEEKEAAVAAKAEEPKKEDKKAAAKKN
ncbi:MAG: DsbA family protein [Pseudomonadota bacterium]